jgi:hypothetical protein
MLEMSATDTSRVGTVRDRTSTISRVVTLVAVVVPPVGLLAAMGGLFWNVAFHPRTRSATCSDARTTAHATRRGTTGSSHCSSSGRAGTTPPRVSRLGAARARTVPDRPVVVVVRGLEKLGVVWNVKVPDARQIGRRRVQNVAS